MAQLIIDENGLSDFFDNNNESGFVDQDGDFFATINSIYRYSVFNISIAFWVVLILT